MSRASDYSGWAQRYAPARAPLFVHNEIVIDAAPDAVWDVLVDALRWRKWFSNALCVRIRQPVGTDRLALGSVFTWASWLFPLRSVVVRCDGPSADAERPLLIAWDFEGWRLHGHHVWIISPTCGGCLVVTEEVEVGTVPRLLDGVLRRMMWISHERWVIALRAETRRRSRD